MMQMEIWEFLLMMLMAFLAGGLVISLAYDKVNQRIADITLDEHYLQNPID